MWTAEWDAARRLGLPISTHLASDAAAAARGGVAALARRRGLGPDVQLVHLTAASRRELDQVAAAGSPVSISPWTELEVGYGLPPVPAMLAAGVLLGLSVDNMVLAGHADMMGVMRVTLDLARGLTRRQDAVEDAAALRWATCDGARSIGMDDRVGTIMPGRRADIILVRTDALHTAPVGSSAALLTHAARADDVRFVMIDGVIHKRDGALTRVDRRDLLARATRSIDRIKAAAGVGAAA